VSDRRQEWESWQDLARARLAVADLTGALEAIRTGVDTFRSVLPAESPQLGGALFLLGDVLRRDGRPREAVSCLEEAHAILLKKPPRNPRDLAELEAALAATRAALKRQRLRPSSQRKLKKKRYGRPVSGSRLRTVLETEESNMPTGSRRPLALSAAVALVLGLVSCNKSPTSPSPPVPTPGPVTIVALRLVAPSEIAPGESVQLTANAVKSDGSIENVSGQVEWTVRSVTASSVVSLTDSGLATGTERGEAVVTVRFEGRAAEATTFVLPKGTFRLAGVVSESGVGLEGVTITVIAGVGLGLMAVTDFRGDYALYGVAGPVQIRASLTGYVENTQEIEVAAHRMHSLELVSSRPRDEYAGTYTLTVTAADTPGRPCAPGFPEELKRRVYIAQIEQTGADLEVSLSGADFIRGHFRGAVTQPGKITFWIRPASVWDYDEEEVVERLSDGTRLFVSGTIDARSTPSGISGTVNRAFGGSIWRDSGSGTYSQNSGCPLDRFEMVRR
jgi:hypothetical protein